MMSNLDMTIDGLVSQNDARHYLHPTSWPFAVDQNTQPRDGQRNISPLQTNNFPFEALSQEPNMIADWQFQQLQSHHLPYHHHHEEPAPASQFTAGFSLPLHQASPVDLLSVTQAHLEPGLLDGSYLPLSTSIGAVPFAFQDFHPDLINFPHGLPDMSYTQSILGSSPSSEYLEVGSLTSSSSDNGWTVIGDRRSTDPMFPDMFINPTQTLHDHTPPDSSFSSDMGEIGSFVEVSHQLNSPGSDNIEYPPQIGRRLSHDHTSYGSQSPVSPVPIVRPIAVPSKESASPTRSPASQSSASPPSRKPSRKSPIAAKTTETKIRKQSQIGKPETEKRVGKRKGPLKPDQRKQANEIRKLRACLRCKFLKKTCDTREPCGGCQPSHARLWQVPCTRIDIKDIGYFMKDWKADYERHITLEISVGNIKGFSEHERPLFVTHGYGQLLPISAREVYVRDDECFNVDWVETVQRQPTQFEVRTAKLSAGVDGISHSMLSEYLDRHIDGNGSFEKFVDDYFEGTQFLTQMLKTAFRYYYRTKLPVIRKALKLILAYNLTVHVTMVEGIGEEEGFLGKIDKEASKFRGKTMAPVMINFQIKYAMAEMWRELQKDVLEELSVLYSSVYTRDKLKNWPTIFILASIMLAVWEEMQFDCHYRVPDAGAVDKFCHDMESTPVGVIVGLFQAISQKLPAFTEWETHKHHHLLNSNMDVCATMTEVREHVTQHEAYLRGRASSKFTRNDFDCLSNKFLARLVIRAN